MEDDVQSVRFDVSERHVTIRPAVRVAKRLIAEGMHLKLIYCMETIFEATSDLSIGQFWERNHVNG
jgi:hypothetical protein